MVRTLLIMFVTLASAGAAEAQSLKRVGLLPSLDDKGAVIGLLTIDNAALSSVAETAPALTVVPPSELRTPWEESGCQIVDDGCVAKFARSRSLDAMVAIVLTPLDDGIEMTTTFIEAERGSTVVSIQSVVPLEAELAEAEAKARVSALMSTALAHGALIVEFTEHEAAIALDGVGVGISPLVKTLKWVPAGEHTLRADLSDGRTVSQTVTVVAGETATARLDFPTTGSEAAAPDEAIATERASELSSEQGPNILMWSGVGVAAAGAGLALVGGAVVAGLFLDGLAGAPVLNSMVPTDADAGVVRTIGVATYYIPVVGGLVMLGGAGAAGAGLLTE